MVKKNNKLEGVLHTPITQSPEAAVDKKIKQLQGSILGRPIVRLNVECMRDVWVPYCYLIYHFRAERHIIFKKNGLEKTGEAGVVFDLNEAHPFQYDIYESGDPILTKNTSDKKQRIRMEAQIPTPELLKQAEEYIQDKIMKRFYGAEGELTLKKKQNFFRPAVELDILYRQKNKNKRYVYLDDFGVQSEHILGLKYRVENNF